MTKEEKVAYDKQYKKNNPAKIKKKNTAYLSRPRNRIHKLALNARNRVKVSNRDIDTEFLFSLENTLYTHCACCSAELDYSMGQGNRPRSLSPSLDRIDNEKGYIRGNVAIICRACNHIKSDSSITKLKQIIKYMEDNNVK